ncbi:MAG: hypothetical protein O7A03_06840 [Alphaproteobacteria bacterium]|nr:hypothetical protein [Alphaproteobacteria bacterium]
MNDQTPPLVRLIIRPHPHHTGTKSADRFDAFLDGEFICTSREPLFAGARELLARGYDPSTLMTTRHEGKAFDSFKPAPIGKLAKLMIEESDAGGLRMRKWKPHPMADSCRGRVAQTRVAAE